MELLSRGTNPFVSFKIIGSLKFMLLFNVYYETKEKYEKFAKCFSPFAIWLSLNTPSMVLKSLINKYLGSVDDIKDIAFMPITKMIEKDLLLPEHLKVLEQKLSDAIDKLHRIGKDSKLRMKEFLSFGSLDVENYPSLNKITAIENYPLLNKITAIAELILYIDKPYTQDQMDYNVCGACAFSTALTIQAPDVLVHIVLTLLDKGEVCYPIHLKTNESIRKHTQHISLLLYHSLKNTDPLINYNYNPADNFRLFTSLTPPEQITGWMQQIFCSEIKDHTKIQQSIARVWHPLASIIYPRGIHNKDTLFDLDFKAQFDLMQQQIKDGGYLSIAYIDLVFFIKNTDKVIETTEFTNWVLELSKNFTNIISKSIGIQVDHYVVIDRLNINQQDNSLVDINILTYGTNFNLTIPMAELKNIWKGMVSAKLPAELLALTMGELMSKEEKASIKQHPKDSSFRCISTNMHRIS